MRTLLLDTHAFLWFVFDDPRLSESAAEAMAQPDAELVLSVASLWEITIKRQVGKLDLGMELGEFFHRYVEQRMVTLLPLQLPHLMAYDALPWIHRDPFDRMVVAQAKTLGLSVVTGDPHFAPYGLEVLW